MADGLGGYEGGNFTSHIAKYIGETVTIFCSCGGQSGSGLTGVVLAVNDCFVRLLTRVGPPPGCALGNACTGFNAGAGYWGGGHMSRFGAGAAGAAGAGGGYGYGGPVLPASELSAQTAGGWNGYPVATVGSVTDIPIAAIVSFVHNAV